MYHILLFGPFVVQVCCWEVIGIRRVSEIKWLMLLERMNHGLLLQETVDNTPGGPPSSLLLHDQYSSSIPYPEARQTVCFIGCKWRANHVEAEDSPT
ncbi:hypothetical protein F4680DRAFT_431338 [Xylaria scruposa]|nr:hypothetical protein F4680DRAFT_431338 [Xylaria scruposa]